MNLLKNKFSLEVKEIVNNWWIRGFVDWNRRDKSFIEAYEIIIRSIIK